MTKPIRQSITISERNNVLLKRYAEARGLTINSAIANLMSDGLDSWLVSLTHADADLFKLSEDVTEATGVRDGRISNLARFQRIFSLLNEACLKIDKDFYNKNPFAMFDEVRVALVPEKLNLFDQQFVTKTLQYYFAQMVNCSPLIPLDYEHNFEYDDFLGFILTRFLGYDLLTMSYNKPKVDLFLQKYHDAGKILIAGETGSGKSTLAFALACDFGTPVVAKRLDGGLNTYRSQIYTIDYGKYTNGSLSDRLNRIRDYIFMDSQHSSVKSVNAQIDVPVLVIQIERTVDDGKLNRAVVNYENTMMRLPNF